MKINNQYRPIDEVPLTLSRVPFIVKEALAAALRPSSLFLIVGVIAVSQVVCFLLAYSKLIAWLILSIRLISICWQFFLV